jgi:hypothetical protein
LHSQRLHGRRAPSTIHCPGAEPRVKRFKCREDLRNDHRSTIHLDRLYDLGPVDGLETANQQQSFLVLFGGTTVQEMHHHRPPRGRLLGVVASDARVGESLQQLVAGGKIGACHGLV